MTILDRWLEENQEADALDVNLDVGLELFDRTFDAVSKEQLPIVGYYLERFVSFIGGICRRMVDGLVEKNQWF